MNRLTCEQFRRTLERRREEYERNPQSVSADEYVEVLEDKILAQRAFILELNAYIEQLEDQNRVLRQHYAEH